MTFSVHGYTPRRRRSLFPDTMTRRSGTTVFVQRLHVSPRTKSYFLFVRFRKRGRRVRPPKNRFHRAPATNTFFYAVPGDGTAVIVRERWGGLRNGKHGRHRRPTVTRETKRDRNGERLPPIRPIRFSRFFYSVVSLS